MEGRLCLHSGFWSSWICPRLGFELCRCAAVKLTARMVVWATFSLPPHLLGINHFYELLVSSVLSWENWMGMMRHFHAVDELKLIRHQIFFLKLKLSSLLCNHFSNCFLIVVNFKLMWIQIIPLCNYSEPTQIFVNSRIYLQKKNPSEITHITCGNLFNNENRQAF